MRGCEARPMTNWLREKHVRASSVSSCCSSRPITVELSVRDRDTLSVDAVFYLNWGKNHCLVVYTRSVRAGLVQDVLVTTLCKTC